jgi:hypothetical protein
MLCRTTREKGKTKTNRLNIINRDEVVNLFYDSNVLKGNVQYNPAKTQITPLSSQALFCISLRVLSCTPEEFGGRDI